MAGKACGVDAKDVWEGPGGPWRCLGGCRGPSTPDWPPRTVVCYGFPHITRAKAVPRSDAKRKRPSLRSHPPEAPALCLLVQTVRSCVPEGTLGSALPSSPKCKLPPAAGLHHRREEVGRQRDRLELATAASGLDQAERGQEQAGGKTSVGKVSSKGKVKAGAFLTGCALCRCLWGSLDSGPETPKVA